MVFNCPYFSFLLLLLHLKICPIIILIPKISAIKKNMDAGIQFRCQSNDLFNQHIVTGMDRKAVK